jgi:hypothetical protein
MPTFDVFLSHSSVDKPWVIQLKDDLLLRCPSSLLRTANPWHRSPSLRSPPQADRVPAPGA